MQKIPMVDLKGQYQKIRPQIDKAIEEVLNSCQYIKGKPVRSFAQNLADYLGVKHVIPCGNGTDALQIALMALQLEPGDEVITSPFSFFATAEVIGLLRLKPVFVDIHPDTFNIDDTQIEAAITPRTKCIIPVHLFGQAANMEAIMAIAEKHNLYVVEDNAQAIGSEFQFSNGTAKKSGSIGDIGCTSFFPSKNLGCFGDGGAMFTNDDNLAERLQLVANHGMKVRYYHDELGVNSRLDSIQAAVLDVKLQHLDEYCVARQRAAALYDKLLAGKDGIAIPLRVSNSSHVFHQYTILLDRNRDQVREAMRKKGIATAIYYPVPIHLQAAFSDSQHKKGAFPITEKASEQVLSLPMHTELNEAIQSQIVAELLEACRQENYSLAG